MSVHLYFPSLGKKILHENYLIPWSSAQSQLAICEEKGPSLDAEAHLSSDPPVLQGASLRLKLI